MTSSVPAGVWMRVGWVPATARQYQSVRLDTDTIAITRSGGHKGFLSEDSVIAVSLDGNGR